MSTPKKWEDLKSGTIFNFNIDKYEDKNAGNILRANNNSRVKTSLYLNIVARIGPGGLYTDQCQGMIAISYDALLFLKTKAIPQKSGITLTVFYFFSMSHQIIVRWVHQDSEKFKKFINKNRIDNEI